MKDSPPNKLFFILSMLIFGSIGLFRRGIDIPSSMLACSRAYIGVIFLLLVLFCGKKKPDLASIKKNLIPLLLSGVAVGVNWILLFEAYLYTSVSVATVCYYTAPVIVIILSPFILKEKLGLKTVLCVVSSVIGTALISGLTAAENAGIKGILLGLGAAAFYAAVMVLNKFISDIDSYSKTVVQLSVAALSLTPYVLLTEDVASVSLDLKATVILVLVGVVHTGVAYALYFGSMGKISSQSAAILSYIDPIFAVILSFSVLREPLTLPTAIGVVLVLGAAAVNEIKIKK